VALADAPIVEPAERARHAAVHLAPVGLDRAVGGGGAWVASTHAAEGTMSLSDILVGAVLVVVATALLVVLVRVLAHVRRRTAARLQALADLAAPRLRVRGLVLLRADQLRRAAGTGVTVGAWLLGLTGGYLYLTFVLTRFVWTRSWGNALGGFLVSTLEELGLGVVRAVPNLFVVLLILAATRFAAGVVRSVFDAAGERRITLPGIHAETAQPTRRIATVLIWLFAVTLAYPYLPGSSSAAFKGVSVFAGVLFTLGSAGLVGQAMSGLVVMYSRSFRVGDFVQVGGIQGSVVELGLLSTRLCTPKNEYVSLPNGVVVGGAVTNYSKAAEYQRSLVVYSSVTIGYDVAWRRVHELLMSAARRTEGVLAEPAPYVLQRALDDSYVEYQVNAAVDPLHAAEQPLLYSRLHAAIQDAFAQAGVEILSPSYHAVRDGNAETVPAERRPEGTPRAFRVATSSS
jgi:small-conductance mechanosensitive channel